MKGIDMYTKIQQLKALKYSQRGAAEALGIHRETVRRYWDMSVEDYEAEAAKIRKLSVLDEYKTVILSWIRKNPRMSSAQICDWLKEDYAGDFKERTVSRYVNRLRAEYDLPRVIHSREFTAVEELPPGQQMQVDFGEMYMPRAEGGRIKVRFAAFVLSHSRYKFVWFQSRPFCTIDLITALRECFKYIGGMPQELVFDQDSIVCVSENNGDIVYTSEFEKFRQECEFRIYMCRGADPQTKGKIENVVRYVKHGFVENRIYPCDDSTLNSLAVAWLERTANAKIHGTTRRIPAEVFAEEREQLLPIPIIEDISTAKIVRTVRKDNTILYNGNRYSVPIGTYTHQKEVCVEIEGSILKIYTTTSDPICEHTISESKGLLIKNRSHERDTESPVNGLKEKLKEKLGHRADEYIDRLYVEKKRYARDQFKIIFTMIDLYGVEDVLNAIGFCDRNRLYSASLIKDFLESKAPVQKSEQAEIPQNIPIDKPVYHTQVAKRSLDIYAKAGER